METAGGKPIYIECAPLLVRSSRRPHSILLVFHYGFGAAECGFKGMKPWEEEHRRKNEMEGLWVGQKEESVREGGSGLLGFDPS